MNADALARMKAARTPSGKFGTQAHGQSTITLKGDAGMFQSRLLTHAQAMEDDANETGLAANKVRLAAAAREMAEAHPGAARAFIDRENVRWECTQVLDTSGEPLGSAARTAVEEALGNSGAAYEDQFTTEGIDLAGLQHWVPEDLDAGLEDNRADRGAHRATLALNTAVEDDEEDDETRLADLLTDLRHFADAKGIDMYAALDRSYGYYRDDKESDTLA